MSKDKFHEKYSEAYCDKQAECNAEIECGPSEGGGPSESADCDYDAAKAKECLNGEFTCNTEVPGFEFAEPPAVCLEVYGNCRSGTGESGGSFGV